MLDKTQVARIKKVAEENEARPFVMNAPRVSTKEVVALCVTIEWLMSILEFCQECAVNEGGKCETCRQSIHGPQFQSGRVRVILSKEQVAKTRALYYELTGADFVYNDVRPDIDALCDTIEALREKVGDDKC